MNRISVTVPLARHSLGRAAAFYVSAAALCWSGCTGSIAHNEDTSTDGERGGSGGSRTGGQNGGTPGTGNEGGEAGGGELPTFVNHFACEGWQSLPRDPGPAPLRRLTRVEYANSIRDLFGAELAEGVAVMLPADERSEGFDNNAYALTVSGPLVEGYFRSAEAISDKAGARLSSLVTCGTTDTCATQFITNFGRKVWRRPLTADEQKQLQDIYAAGKAADGFAGGIKWVLQALLQSSSFIYRSESGAEKAAEIADAVKVQDFEMAARLSYFLWRSTPDDVLLDAAAAGGLRTPEQIREQAMRMLSDGRAQDGSAVASFFAQWLGLEGVRDLVKDTSAYPTFSPDTAESMAKESEAFLDWWLWDADRKLSTLLTTSTSFVDAELAAIYADDGMTLSAGNTMTMVERNADKRAGILTQPAMLARYSYAKQSSPIHRGLLVTEKFLCFDVPSPPPGLNAQEPVIAPGSNTRERFAAHREASCASCHNFIDPPGYAFEHYDATGRYRETDLGKPVDATFTIDASLSEDPALKEPMDGAVQLAHALAGSQDVGRCFATNWFRFAMGRGPTVADERNVCSAFAAMDDAGGDVRALLIALTQTDAFLYRKTTLSSTGACTK